MFKPEVPPSRPLGLHLEQSSSLCDRVPSKPLALYPAMSPWPELSVKPQQPAVALCTSLYWSGLLDHVPDVSVCFLPSFFSSGLSSLTGLNYRAPGLSS